MIQQNIQVLTNSYRTLVKTFDFIIINAVLSLIIPAETAIDISAGLLFSTL